MQKVINATSRAAARTLKAEYVAMGFFEVKVVDNGADSENRWAVSFIDPEIEEISAENFEKVEQAIAEPAAPTPELIDLLKRETLTIKKTGGERTPSGRKKTKWEFVNVNHGKQAKRKQYQPKQAKAQKPRRVQENALTIALQSAFGK